MNLLVEDPPVVAPSGRRGRLGAVLGVASLLLLGAAFLWAHHWGPLTDTIVIAWGLSWMAALGVSIWALRANDAGRTLAKVGLVLACVSILALAASGIAAAAGVDPAGLCGGG